MEYRLIDEGLLPSPPRNHPGGSTNTLRFGGGYEIGDYERELAAPLCHGLTPLGLALILPSHNKIHDTL